MTTMQELIKAITPDNAEETVRELIKIKYPGFEYDKFEDILAEGEDEFIDGDWELHYKAETYIGREEDKLYIYEKGKLVTSISIGWDDFGIYFK